MYLSETDHSLSIPDPHDSDDIEKVKGQGRPAMAIEILWTWSLLNHWMDWNQTKYFPRLGIGVARIFPGVHYFLEKVDHLF